jgi:prephenate dehydrogenase
MMLGVLQTNRENVLNALHEIQSQLAEVEAALSSEDFAKLETLLNQSRSAYQSLTGN